MNNASVILLHPIKLVAIVFDVKIILPGAKAKLNDRFPLKINSRSFSYQFINLIKRVFAQKSLHELSLKLFDERVINLRFRSSSNLFPTFEAPFIHFSSDLTWKILVSFPMPRRFLTHKLFLGDLFSLPWKKCLRLFRLEASCREGGSEHFYRRLLSLVRTQKHCLQRICGKVFPIDEIYQAKRTNYRIRDRISSKFSKTRLETARNLEKYLELLAKLFQWLMNLKIFFHKLYLKRKFNQFW